MMMMRLDLPKGGSCQVSMLFVSTTFSTEDQEDFCTQRFGEGELYHLQWWFELMRRCSLIDEQHN